MIPETYSRSSEDECDYPNSSQANQENTRHKLEILEWDSDISIGVSNIKKYSISWITKMGQLLKTHKLLIST